MLSRPKPIQFITSVSTFPLIFMASLALCLKANVQKGFSPGLKDVTTVSHTQSFAKNHRLYYLTNILNKNPFSNHQDIFMS